MNELEERWANTYYFMKDIVSPNDMYKMTWIRFFHLYQTHSNTLETQVKHLENNG